MRSRHIVQEGLLGASWAVSRAGREPEECEEVLSFFHTFAELQEREGCRSERQAGETAGKAGSGSLSRGREGDSFVPLKREKKEGGEETREGESVVSLMTANVMEAYLRRRRVEGAVVWGLEMLKRLGILSGQSARRSRLRRMKSKQKEVRENRQNEGTGRALHSSEETKSLSSPRVSPEGRAFPLSFSSPSSLRDACGLAVSSPAMLSEDECGGSGGQAEEDEEGQAMETRAGEVLLPEHAVVVERLLLALSLEGKAREALAVFRLTYKGLAKALAARWSGVFLRQLRDGRRFSRGDREKREGKETEKERGRELRGDEVVEHVKEGKEKERAEREEPLQREDDRASSFIWSARAPSSLPAETSPATSLVCSPVLCSSSAFQASCPPSPGLPSPSPTFSSLYHPPSFLLARNVDPRLLLSLQRPPDSFRFLPSSLVRLVDAQQALRESLWRVLSACQSSAQLRTLQHDLNGGQLRPPRYLVWRKQSKQDEKEEGKRRIAVVAGGAYEKEKREVKQKETRETVLARQEENRNNTNDAVRIALQALSVVYGGPDSRRSSASEPQGEESSLLPDRSTNTKEEEQETAELLPQADGNRRPEEEKRAKQASVPGQPALTPSGRPNETTRLPVQRERRCGSEEKRSSFRTNDEYLDLPFLSSSSCSGPAPSGAPASLSAKEHSMPSVGDSARSRATSSLSTTADRHNIHEEDSFRLLSSLFSRADFISQTLTIGVLEAARRYREALDLLSRTLCLCSRGGEGATPFSFPVDEQEDRQKNERRLTPSGKKSSDFRHADGPSQRAREENKLPDFQSSLPSFQWSPERDTQAKGQERQREPSVLRERRQLSRGNPWTAVRDERDLKPPLSPHTNGDLMGRTAGSERLHLEKTADSRTSTPLSHEEQKQVGAISSVPSSSLSAVSISFLPHHSRQERLFFWKAWQRRLHARVVEASQWTTAPSAIPLRDEAVKGGELLGKEAYARRPQSIACPQTESERTEGCCPGEQEKEGDEEEEKKKNEEKAARQREEEGVKERDELYKILTEECHRGLLLRGQKEAKEMVGFPVLGIPYQMYPFSQAYLRQQRELHAVTLLVLRGRRSGSLSKRRWISPLLSPGGDVNRRKEHLCSLLAQVSKKAKESLSECLEAVAVRGREAEEEEGHASSRETKGRRRGRKEDTLLTGESCEGETRIERQGDAALQLSLLRELQKERLERKRRRQRWRLRVLLSSRIRTRIGWRGLWGRVFSPRKLKANRFLLSRPSTCTFGRSDRNESPCARTVMRREQVDEDKKQSLPARDQQRAEKPEGCEEDEGLGELVAETSFPPSVGSVEDEAGCDVLEDLRGRRPPSSLSRLVCEIEKNGWILDAVIQEVVAVAGLMETARRQRDWVGVLRVFWQLFERRRRRVAAQQQLLKEERAKEAESLAGEGSRPSTQNSPGSQLKTESERDPERPGGESRGEATRRRTFLGDRSDSQGEGQEEEENEQERSAFEQAIHLALEAYYSLGLPGLAADTLQQCLSLQTSPDDMLKTRDIIRDGGGPRKPKRIEAKSRARERREYRAYLTSEKALTVQQTGGQKEEKGDTVTEREGREATPLAWGEKDDDDQSMAERRRGERPAALSSASSPCNNKAERIRSDSSSSSLFSSLSLSSLSPRVSDSSSDAETPQHLQGDDASKSPNTRFSSSVSASSPSFSLRFEGQSLLQAGRPLTCLPVEVPSRSSLSSPLSPSSLVPGESPAEDRRPQSSCSHSPEALLKGTSSFSRSAGLSVPPSLSTTAECNRLLSSLLLQAKLSLSPPLPALAAKRRPHAGQSRLREDALSSPANAPQADDVSSPGHSEEMQQRSSSSLPGATTSREAEPPQSDTGCPYCLHVPLREPGGFFKALSASCLFSEVLPELLRKSETREKMAEDGQGEEGAAKSDQDEKTKEDESRRGRWENGKTERRGPSNCKGEEEGRKGRSRADGGAALIAGGEKRGEDGAAAAVGLAAQMGRCMTRDLQWPKPDAVRLREDCWPAAVPSQSLMRADWT